MNAEEKRLDEARKREKHWKRWGNYVSERAWGTVREDYSESGAAWESLPFEQAHQKRLSLERRRHRRILRPSSTALFRRRFLERKGRDFERKIVRLDGQRGQSRRRCQRAVIFISTQRRRILTRNFFINIRKAEFPYQKLDRRKQSPRQIASRNTNSSTPEFLTKTNISIVSSNTPKRTPKMFYIKIEIFNRAAESAAIHVLPHLWFRNTWSWRKTRKSRS